MSETDTDDTQPMADAFAATGRAMAGEEPAAEQQKAVDLPNDAPEWLVDLTEKIAHLEKRVAEREQKRADRRATIDDLIERIEELDENIAELEKIYL